MPLRIEESDMIKRREFSRWMVLLLGGTALLLTQCSAVPAVRSTTPPTAAMDIAAAAPAATIVASATLMPTAAPTATSTAEASSTVPPATATAELTAAPSPTVADAVGKPALVSFVSGLESPTDLTHAGDGSGLLYVLEQPGRIRVIQNAALLETPFLDIVDRVGSSANEQGLLGLAFAPDFKTSSRFYVNYTNTEGDTVVAGFVAAADRLTADPASEWQVLTVDQPYGNHNGGQVKFGPDGMLFIGMGDGGSGGDPQNFAQNPQSMLGKMLRVDVSESSAADPYRVPAGNPAFGDGSLQELWSIGLRNPWRFSFDRATGDLFIADVGQGEIEEVNWQPAGRSGDNYGWKLREGTREYSGKRADGFTEPVMEYEHGDDGCSITGGYVYRGTALTSLSGAYIYGDYCSGRIWMLMRTGDGWNNEQLFDTDYRITSFGEDEAGELYVLDRSGTIYKLAAEE
jgi:glucose/arabinose dehydrogenase